MAIYILPIACSDSVDPFDQEIPEKCTRTLWDIILGESSPISSRIAILFKLLHIMHSIDQSLIYPFHQLIRIRNHSVDVGYWRLRYGHDYRHCTCDYRNSRDSSCRLCPQFVWLWYLWIRYHSQSIEIVGDPVHTLNIKWRITLNRFIGDIVVVHQRHDTLSIAIYDTDPIVPHLDRQ